jgi:hypothetical protein
MQDSNMDNAKFSPESGNQLPTGTPSIGGVSGTQERLKECRRSRKVFLSCGSLFALLAGILIATPRMISVIAAAQNRVSNVHHDGIDFVVIAIMIVCCLVSLVVASYYERKIEQLINQLEKGQIQ